MIALGATTHVRDGFANPCDEESQYYCLRVDDLSHEAPFGVARGLVLDHLLHGVNHESEPGMLLAPYLHLSDELMLGYLGPRATNPKVFFAGGGGYTHPRAVAALAPESEVTVAEIDPTVTRFAREHLFVDTERMRVLHTDARVALTKLEDERFDAIVGDVFQDIAMPYHLATREFAALVRERLTDRGVFLINVLDAHPDPLLVKAMMKTLSLEFRHVHVWLEEIPPAPVRTTYVISASNLAEPPPVLVAQRGFDRRWLRVTDRVSSTGTPLAEIPVLRDDFVPVERLVSRLLITPLGR